MPSPAVVDHRLAPCRAMLATSPWYTGLDDAQRARVDADVTAHTVAAGGYVVRRGERVEAWLGVIDGLLKMSNMSAEGKLATFAGLPDGAWFGEGTLLKNEARRYDVIALRASHIAVMPKPTFEWLLARSIPFNRFLLDHLNERLGQFIAMVENDRLLDPDARVARCLASMVHPLLYPGNGMSLRIGQEEIGNLAGASRQRVNQALKRLEAEGLLAIEYGGVRIVQFERLRAFGS